MAYFNGTYPCTMDAKGRVSLPAKFRKVLGQDDNVQVYLLPGDQEGSIFILPASVWQSLVEALKQLPKDANSAALKAYAGAQSYDVDVDRQGRIMIPKVLMEEAKVTQEFLIAGALDKMVLWDGKAFEAHKENEKDAFQKLVTSVMP
jgi:MraZ protein